MKQLQRIITIIVLILVSGIPVFSQTGHGDLMITITGFENSKGVVKVALVNSKRGYEDNLNVKGLDLQITDQQAGTVMKSIPFGEYAVKVFHDENQNNELDTKILGIPIERYGFSNNARSAFGPPGFDAVKFEHKSGQTRIQIQVK